MFFQRLYSKCFWLFNYRLFDGNRLSGSIPSTLGLVQTVEVLWVEHYFNRIVVFFMVSFLHYMSSPWYSLELNCSNCNSRLDRNALTGTVPSNLNNLTNVNELCVVIFNSMLCYSVSVIFMMLSNLSPWCCCFLLRNLAHNNLTGNLPNLTQMKSLSYV